MTWDWTTLRLVDSTVGGRRLRFDCCLPSTSLKYAVGTGRVALCEFQCNSIPPGSPGTLCSSCARHRDATATATATATTAAATIAPAPSM